MPKYRVHILISSGFEDIEAEDEQKAIDKFCGSSDIDYLLRKCDEPVRVVAEEIYEDEKEEEEDV